VINLEGRNDCCSVQVQAGHTPTVEVLKLLEAFTNENNFTVWSAINNCLSKLSSLLSCTDYEDLFKAYGRRLLQGVYSRVGWDPRDNESEYADATDVCQRGSLVIEGEKWFRN
jgi:puromycin-sensitive aminopeptidase